MDAKRIPMLVGYVVEGDGIMVTAPAWPAHPDWMRQFPKLLGSRIEP